jgi:hypothetical protein
MELTSITFNGTTHEAVPTGTFTWTAADITLTLRPNMTWRAVRGEQAVIGPDSTAQTAVDALAAAEHKADREASARQRLTAGQLFAREIRAYLHIGPRTRRHREGNDLYGNDLHRAIVQTVIEVTTGQWIHPDRIEPAIRPAFGAALSHDRSITSGRSEVLVVAYVNSLSPWDLCALLGEMVDADIIHVGGGERWYSELAQSLAWDDRGRAIRRELQTA